MTVSAKKPMLAYPELRDIIDLSLWAGQLLLQYGAESARVEETVHRLGTALGCDWMDILVSPNVVIVTTTSGTEFRTKVRRVVNIGVNMTIIAEVNALSRRVEAGELDRFAVRAELERIGKLKSSYNRWLVVAMVGLACAAFSQLFGGDEAVFAVTFAASSVGMFVRQVLAHRFFNALLVTAVTAFTAGLVASSAAVFNLTPQPETALAACVLLLVPGVPLITSTEDLIQGHLITGIARGVVGGLISLAIALGLLLAMSLTGAGL
jgi:uncharacterized membrane protein YjjP (DUF1212 family)